MVALDRAAIRLDACTIAGCKGPAVDLTGPRGAHGNELQVQGLRWCEAHAQMLLLHAPHGCMPFDNSQEKQRRGFR